MAFVQKPTIIITFTFRDDDGKESTSQVHIPAATTPANAVTYATALRSLISALSDALIVNMNVIIGYYENAVGTISSSDVENKGVFTLTTTNGLRSSIAVPSILEAMLQGNNQDIDQSFDEPDAFINAITLGLSGVQPVNASGADLVGVSGAYKQNRRSHISRRVRKG